MESLLANGGVIRPKTFTAPLRNVFFTESSSTFVLLSTPDGLDIQTPLGRERLGSLSVVDASCARADALATGLFVLGLDEGLKLANAKNIPVLFMLRSENIDSGRAQPHFSVREVFSDSFQQVVHSWKPD